MHSAAPAPHSLEGSKCSRTFCSDTYTYTYMYSRTQWHCWSRITCTCTCTCVSLNQGVRDVTCCRPAYIVPRRTCSTSGPVQICTALCNAHKHTMQSNAMRVRVNVCENRHTHARAAYFTSRLVCAYARRVQCMLSTVQSSSRQIARENRSIVQCTQCRILMA